MLELLEKINHYIYYNDCDCEVSYKKHNDSTTICFTHYDVRYTYNNASIRIQDTFERNRKWKLLEKIQQVIAQEEFIEEEF